MEGRWFASLHTRISKKWRCKQTLNTDKINKSDEWAKKSLFYTHLPLLIVPVLAAAWEECHGHSPQTMLRTHPTQHPSWGPPVGVTQIFIHTITFWKIENYHLMLPLSKIVAWLTLFFEWFEHSLIIHLCLESEVTSTYITKNKNKWTNLNKIPTLISQVPWVTTFLAGSTHIPTTCGTDACQQAILHQCSDTWNNTQIGVNNDTGKTHHSPYLSKVNLLIFMHISIYFSLQEQNWTGKLVNMQQK